MYLQFYYHKMLVKYNLTTFISKMLIEEVLTASITAIYVNEKMHRTSQCLKITEKVAFNITSEASYVYILSGQKLIKNAKMVHLASFWKPAIGGQTVLPERSLLIEQKLVENAKIQKLEMRHFWWFSNTVE